MHKRVIAVSVGVGVLACAGMLCSCPPVSCDGNVNLIPFSGRYGYALEGPYDFVGSLTKDALTDPEWQLQGTLTFPTGGYRVGAIEVRIQESYPEQVRVRIPVTPPPPGVVVIQVLETISVERAIKASNQALFTLCIDTVS
ncbi:MAG TPA: hypothetical protein ENN80_04095 [Candidatus Hydrogenedentes bacterium]|mgnify:CR=1 FL=1|nr:hypothetical protein [Candidatus Hydrogenedentota bacterium]